jgi:hypothetical protein
MVKKLVEHEGFCYFQVTEGKPINTAGELNVAGPAWVATKPVTNP